MQPGAEASYLASIVTSCNDAIIGKTLDGIVVSWNPAAARILGYGAQEIIGRPIAILVPADRIGEDSWLVSQVMRGERVEQFETVRRRKDGREIHVSLTVSPLQDQSGKIVGASTIAREITERIRSEQQLVRATQRYLNDAGVVILVLNTDATIRMINQRGSGILGYDDPGDIVGKPWIETFIPANRRETARETFSRHVGGQGGESELHTDYVATRTGEERVIAWYSSILTDEMGRVVASLNAGNDITDRLRSEQALKKSTEQLCQAQKMEAIGHLTGGLAHDFNNLLAAIILNLDMLPNRIKHDRESRESLSAAHGAAVHGADLTRRLLAFARRQPLQPQSLDPNELVTSTFELLRRMLGEAVVVSLDLAPDIWSVIADPVQLASSLTNLATNARDAMPHGGSLTIAASNRHFDADTIGLRADLHPGSYVMFEITDSGTGMTPEVLEHIFEPFYTTKEEGKGSGLGLSMVFGFAKQSGGHLTVHSKPGVGTTFRLYLPRATMEAARPRAVANGSAPNGAGEAILVVEDNALVRRAVTRALAALGYRVLEADGAAAAIAIMESEPVDLLFTDVVMPGKMDGYQLASHVLARWSGTKVILTSGFPDSKIGNDVEAAARFRWLAKPYRANDLSHCVSEILKHDQVVAHAMRG
jgi:PAS domain S-box-containing protein